MTTTPRGTRWLTVLQIAGGLIYLAVAALLIGWLVQVRNWSFENQATPDAQADWQRWREDAARPPTTEGSVARRVPLSSEPPLLVLMREHFVMSVAATLFFWTALFAPLFLMLRGVMRQSLPVRAPPIERPRGQ